MKNSLCIKMIHISKICYFLKNMIIVCRQIYMCVFICIYIMLQVSPNSSTSNLPNDIKQLESITPITLYAYTLLISGSNPSLNYAQYLHIDSIIPCNHHTTPSFKQGMCTHEIYNWLFTMQATNITSLYICINSIVLLYPK